MKTLKHLSLIHLLLFGVMPTGYVCAEQEQIKKWCRRDKNGAGGIIF